LLAVVLCGVIGGFAWSMSPRRLSALGPFSGLALVLGALGYLDFVLRQLGGKWRTLWGRFLAASAGWMVVWAVVALVLRSAARSSGPGVYSDPTRTLLMELAIFGFAQNSIYGFGQKLLPGLLRGGSTRQGLFGIAWIAHNAGVSVLCLSHLADLNESAWLGSVSILAGALFYVAALRGLLHRRPVATRPEAGHSLLPRYIQVAFGWLLIGLVMLAAGDLAEVLRGAAPPHAYLGALRHALTVGFMTTLILGVGQRLLPVFDRTVLARPRLVIPILLLIGIGNALRVASELAIVATPAGFAVMPFSALLEWAALLLFAVNAVATMFHTDLLLTHGRVSSRSSLAVLLGEYPDIEDRLIAAGNQYLQRTRSVPSELTIGSFAESEGLDAAQLVSQLNAWIHVRTLAPLA